LSLLAIVLLLIPVFSNFLVSFFSAESNWQQPHFSVFEVVAMVSALIIVVVILISEYLRLKNSNTNLLEKTRLVNDALEDRLMKSVEETQRFELFTQATGDGIWDWNLRDNEFYFSSRWKSMLGFEDDEFEGSFVEWQNLVHPDDLGNLLMMWAKCTEGETSYTIEYRIQNKSGEYLWVKSRTIALIDDDGDVYRLAGAHTDITDRKIAELKLYDHQKNLELEINERTRDLERANKSLKELASIDGLTGLNNRRAFDEAIKREWNRCKREQQKLSLIMLDIDYFKLYNDTYGHLEGDNVLKMLSGALTATVRRATDIVARYGGEEFVVILPDTDEEQALEAAHKIQKYVDTLNIPAVKESAYKNVTFSMGVGTTIPSENNDWENTLKQVDQALYQAKEEGRNRIIVSPLNVISLKNSQLTDHTS
jgi:diguanylate cyclase (GGDEF)-like protein/PAS domain S-box-containing protein